MDLNPSVDRKFGYATVVTIVLRLVAAIVIGVGLTLLVGMRASAASPYTPEEFKSVESDREGQIRELRDQEINQLRIALGRRVEGNRRADLYLRLAELYLEAYRASFVLEGRTHEKRLTEGKADPFIDRSHSKPILKKGIQACNDILSLGLPYPKIDQVYAFMGFYYDELDDRVNSQQYYQKVIDLFPKSAFVGQAYTEIGFDHYYARNYSKAIQYLEKAAQSVTGPERARVEHRLAWSYYRTRQFDRAVNTLKKAVESAKEGGEKLFSLKEEALRDMAIFMTETGRVDEALSYFKQTAGDSQYYVKALEKLGRQYERNVQPDKAIQVYESILKTSPSSEAAFRVRVKLFDLDLRRGKVREAIARINGKDANLDPGSETETQTAYQNLKAMVRRTATESHERYRKKKERQALDVAELYYSSYMKLFLDKRDSRNEMPEIKMYLAEVKRDLGKSEEATEFYRSVVKSGDKRYSKEAGALWTASLADLIQKQGKNAQGDLSPLEKEFLDAADELSDALENSNEAKEASLRAAQVLAGYPKHQNDAIKRSKKIIEKDAGSAQALVAARLWLQILADRLPNKVDKDAAVDEDRLEDVKDAIEQIRKQSVLISNDSKKGQGKLGAQMADIESRIKIFSIARFEKEQNHAEAAKAYEEFARSSAQGDVAERAYANAMTTYLKGDDWENADRVATEWAKKFSKSKKIDETLRAATTQAFIQGHFETAAQLFDRLGSSHGDLGSIESGAKLFEAVREYARSQALYLTLVSKTRDAESRARHELDLARILMAQNKDRDAAKQLKACLKENARVSAECGAELADLEMKAGQIAESRQALIDVTRLHSAGSSKRGKASGHEGSPYIGYAYFKLAQMLERGTEFSKLELGEAKLAKAVGERLAFFKKLNSACLEAVKAGGPWGVAALNMLANWSFSFASEMEALPESGALEPQRLEAMKKSVAQVSAPLKKKAQETWLDAYQKAVAQEWLSPALPEIADHLADLRVKTPSRAQGPRGGFKVSGADPMGGKEGLEKSLARVRDRLMKNASDADAWIDYGNLLWGSKRASVAKLAYERAIQLSAKNPAALNNRAVVILSSQGEEDWRAALEAQDLLKRAVASDEFYVGAKVNLASLYNYYRHFQKAKPLWEQVIAKSKLAQAYEGLAIAYQGMGQGSQADAAMKRAESASGASEFGTVFFEAAKSSVNGASGASACVEKVVELQSGATLEGFERGSVDRLKKTCETWRDAS